MVLLVCFPKIAFTSRTVSMQLYLPKTRSNTFATSSNGKTMQKVKQATTNRSRRETVPTKKKAKRKSIRVMIVIMKDLSRKKLMVPVAGIEPTRLSSSDFKSDVFTNFTIPAVC